MTENQLYTSFRNEQALSTNLCNCANQDIIFDLENDSYLDKIRVFLVPSLEYRIRSLLEEFVYSTNSRWAKQFPYFKKFIDTIIIWQDFLNKVTKCNIDTIEEMMRNIIKHMIKDDLIICFLDSIILHHRLNKVCRELNTLGIENNILRSLNVWNFVNEQDYLLDCNCSTDFNITMDWNNMNLNTVPCNAKESVKYKKPLARNVYNKSIEHTQPTMSEYREHQRILDPNQNFLQRKENNSNHYSTCVTLGSQNNSINKINRPFNKKFCNTKLKKIRNYLKLKIIVHKIYQEDYKCSTFSSFNVTHLPLPCKPSNLIRRIFEADSSLTESCLIVIKRKFENSLYNVCSCLNSVLEKLNFKLTKALCLNCEIYPGYISFKLKASNIKKCFFVARVPICQNIQKRTIQNYSILSSKANLQSNTEINESKCFEQYKENGTNLNDTLEYIDEETETFNTRCSQLNRSLCINDIGTDILQDEAENNNEKKSACMITENVQNFAAFSCNNSCNDIIGEISNMTSCVNNSEERNGEHCKVLNSTEINCDDVEQCKKRILESNNSITKTNTSTPLVNNVNCMCSSYENCTDTNDEIKNIFNNKDLDNLSQTRGINEHNWICSSNKNSTLETKICNINTCSITSFVQNSECDKQLVELNYNHFSNNNINAIDECFDTQENDNSLNSAKVEIGCNSCCSCRHDDFIDRVIDDISKQNIVCAFETSQDNFDEVKTRNTEHSKSVQISSRNNSDDVNDKNKSTVVATSDSCCNEIVNFPTQALIVSKKENKMLPDKEIFDVKSEIQDFITSPKRLSTSKGRFRSNEDSRNFDISSKEYLRAGNHATSNVSLYHSFATTSEFMMNNERDEFQKSNKLNKLSKLRKHEYVSSRKGIHNVTSTTIKHKTSHHQHLRYLNDYSAETRPPTITKFRNSVDKSVDRIKRLIRTKLKRVLFKNKISNDNKMNKNFWRNKESTKDIRKKTNNKHIRQSYSITSCSTCDCCRQGYTISSQGSSNVILSICRTKRKESEGNIKFRDHRLVDGSKVLLSFRSSKMSPWLYDSLTSITKDIKKQQLNRNNRYDRKKKVRNVINRNTYPCNLQHSRTSMTISSQPTKVSLTENNSNYFGHYTCKRQNHVELCNNKRICKQIKHNQDQRENKQVQQCEQCGNKNEYRDVPIKYTIVDSNESIKTPLSHIWKGNTRNVHQQFYDISEIKRFASSKKNRQIFEKDVSDHFNDSLRKKHVFAILNDAYNDYINDLDLDFKLRLLRYMEFCKSIKHSLMRTLRSDDIYEISMASVSSSDL